MFVGRSLNGRVVSLLNEDAVDAASTDSHSPLKRSRSHPYALPSSIEAPKQEKKRPHLCATCQKGFTTSGHLARHNRVHTGERNHKCPFPGCETRCSRQDNLQQHYRIHLSPRSRRSGGPSTRTAIASAIMASGDALVPLVASSPTGSVQLRAHHEQPPRVVKSKDRSRDIYTPTPPDSRAGSPRPAPPSLTLVLPPALANHGHGQYDEKPIIPRANSNPMPYNPYQRDSPRLYDDDRHTSYQHHPYTAATSPSTASSASTSPIQMTTHPFPYPSPVSAGSTMSDDGSARNVPSQARYYPMQQSFTSSPPTPQEAYVPPRNAALSQVRYAPPQSPYGDAPPSVAVSPTAGSSILPPILHQPPPTSYQYQGYHHPQTQRAPEHAYTSRPSSAQYRGYDQAPYHESEYHSHQGPPSSYARAGEGSIDGYARQPQAQAVWR